MEYKIIPWSVVHSHIPKKSLIDNVVNQHLSQFPDRFFKNRWVDNKYSIQDLYKNDKFLSDIKLPSVTVSYEIDDDPKNTLEQCDWPYSYASHYVAGNLKDYYWRIYRNPNTKTEIYMGTIRKKITLTFKYLFADLNSQEDVHSWMLNQFRYAGPPSTYGLGNIVYTPMPTNMLEYLASAEGYDLTNIDSENEFTQNLVLNSSGRLRKRKVTMRDTSNMMFLTYELPHMQMIQVSNPEKESAESKGQTKTNFGITEILEFEPYVPQMFITKMPEVIKGVKLPDTYKPIHIINKGIDDRLLRTRNYTVDPVSKFLNQVRNLDIISNIEFTIDHNDPEDIDIDSEIYGPLHLDIIRQLKKYFKDPNDYYEIMLFAFDTKLKSGIDFIVDWDKMKIFIPEPIKDGNYKLVGTARRDILIPYMQNALIHTDEFDTIFKKVENSGRKKYKYGIIIPGSSKIEF